MSDPRSIPTPPAGWYPDPQGLPQQRWWTGDRWTADVVSSAPAAPGYASAPPPTVHRPAAPERPLFALPATSDPQQFPTRRELRERMARAAQTSFEPHSQAPFAMPSATVDAGADAVASGEAPVAPVSAVPAASVPAASGRRAATAPVWIGQSAAIATPEALAAAPAPAAAAAPVAPAATPAAVAAAPASTIPSAPEQLVPVGYENFVPFSAPKSTPFLPPATAAQTAASVTPTETAPPLSVTPARATATTDAAPLPAGSAQPESAQPESAQPASARPAAAPASESPTWPFAEPDNEVPYRPFGMIPKVSAGTAEPPERVLTASAWLIAALPVLIAGAAVAADSYLAAYYTAFMAGGLVAIGALVGIWSAVRDARELRTLGFQHPAAPAWILLTPLGYFIARSRATKREASKRALGPLVLWAVGIAVIAAAIVLQPALALSVVTPPLSL
ncbi:DUF2510 domain-containing protein [Galbitalea sp. SE-J8]|uniref:DUF2510 domain-containing protein n=1 Tax=Galbitalea sp. SE-J8 TaxID=3054952 RepID=UPI00259D1219|nr:DUF2510 domain-containing protein [Galbitalea sp. SE-J8]MDM4762616.1 DUF2510 domain-containing protein [Galbitalea sp. SE-J8]